MKVNDIAKAYKGLLGLSQALLPYEQAYELKKLRDRLSPEYDFVTSEERKLLTQYAQTDEDGQIKIEGGNIAMKSEAAARQYLQKLQELHNTQTDIEVTPITIAAANIKISVDDIEALEGFVVFE